MHLKQEFGVGGEQNLQVFKDGKLVRETGFHKNMILDSWFTRLLDPSSVKELDALNNAWCCVGTGATAVNATQTTLISFLATAAEVVGGNTFGSNGVISDYKEVWGQRTFDFAEGAVVGNIAEVGTTASATTPNSATEILTRALVVDVNGNPTTIAVTAAEQLRVIHRIITRLPITPVTGNVDLTTGGNTVNYAYDLRIDDGSNTWGRYGFLDNPKYRTGGIALPSRVDQTLTQNANCAAPTTGGTNQSFVGNPSSYTVVSVTKVGLTSSATVEFKVGSANLVGGFQGLQGGGTAGWAIKFTPAIPKTSLNKFRWTMSITFARI